VPPPLPPPRKRTLTTPLPLHACAQKRPHLSYTPIFHVNGDDPEACVRVAKLAYEYRQAFNKDLVIDMVCYRRRGYSEVDEPSFTQPLMYDLIDKKRSARKIYTENLIGRGDITLEEAEEALRDHQGQLEKVFAETRNPGEAQDIAPPTQRAPISSDVETTSFYGRPRMTRDVDIVVELSPHDAPRLVALFGEDFACAEEERREAIRRRSLFNLIHFERVVKVDFVVRKESEYQRTEFQRRRRMPLDGRQLWVVAPEDLVLSKLEWAQSRHSELQLRDVRNLLESVAELDWSYVEWWARELGVEELLQEVRS
jgi:hypothetical protein